VLQVPIYVSSVMASRANEYFKLLQNWASERVKGAAPGCRAAAFDFSRAQDWQPDLIDKPVGHQRTYMSSSSNQQQQQQQQQQQLAAQGACKRLCQARWRRVIC
jgi:Cft2 family RNA processing exonuclease